MDGTDLAIVIFLKRHELLVWLPWNCMRCTAGECVPSFGSNVLVFDGASKEHQ